jgi:hypothetical protein
VDPVLEAELAEDAVDERITLEAEVVEELLPLAVADAVAEPDPVDDAEAEEEAEDDEVEELIVEDEDDEDDEVELTVDVELLELDKVIGIAVPEFPGA